MTTPSTRDRLLVMLRAHVTDAGWRWLEEQAAAAPSASVDALSAAYSQAAARLGNADLEQPFDRWTAADAGRAVLLIAVADARNADAFVEAAIGCYERGDSNEQRSWLKSTAILPLPERLLPTVIDACRTNILPLFEAVACENPYPAHHFPERNFNQLVLKALFNNVALARIVDLPARLNPELARMAGDYAAERRAAGRSVPADIGLALQENRVTEERAR